MPAPYRRLAPSAQSTELAEALRKVRADYEGPQDFPPEALAEAADAAAAVSFDDLVDLRDIPFCTVDPAGSLDLDQALHLARTGETVTARYAIADVPFFVHPGGALDGQARARGTSVYLPDGIIPLHPTELSEGAASLLPDQDRRAFVWTFVLDDRAEVTEHRLERAIVRSRRKWAYEEAQRAIDDGTAPPELSLMKWFGEQRAEREADRGGASLTMPEVEIERDGDDYRLVTRATLPLEQWNSQLSLLTGMVAAEIMIEGSTGILRTMPPADEDAIERFRAQTRAIGLPWTDGSYGSYLRSLQVDDPRAAAVSQAAASLFRGAGYRALVDEKVDPADVEQAALAAPYAHVTAPLRRLVDRFGLVACHAIAAGAPVPDWARTALPDLPAIMAETSRRAGQAENAALAHVEAAVLAPRVGSTVDAVVLEAHKDRARVQLVDPLVEEWVPDAALTAGTVVSVRVVSTDIAEGEVTLALAG